MNLGRRLVTIPGYVLAAGLVWTALPLLLLLALLFDVVWGHRLVTSRMVLFLAVYLVCEVAGLAASLALWLAKALWPSFWSCSAGIANGTTVQRRPSSSPSSMR